MARGKFDTWRAGGPFPGVGGNGRSASFRGGAPFPGLAAVQTLTGWIYALLRGVG